MSLRPVVSVRLVVLWFLSVLVTLGANAQSCTAPAITPVNVAYCVGEPVTLDAGSGWATYQWSNGQTGRYMTDTPAVDTTYTVTVSDGASCTVTSDPYMHRVSGSLTPPAITAPSSVCTYVQTTATAQYPAGTTPSSYDRIEWTITNGHFYDPVGTEPTTEVGESVNFIATGPDPVTLTATAMMGMCRTPEASMEIPLGPGDPPAITATPEICPMGSGNASVAPPPEGGSWAQVTWTITNGHFGWDPYYGQYRTTTSGESTQFYGDGSGNPIDLRAHAYGAGDYCAREASVTVTARTIEPPVITATAEICPMGSGNASVAPPAEGGSWAYVDWQITNGHFGWDPYTGQYRTSTSGESTQFYGDGSGNPIDLRVRTVDSQYCEAVSSRTVTARTIQPPVITATAEICPMGSGNASVAPPAEGGSWAYVDWQITNGHFGWDLYTGQYRTSTSGETVQFYGDGSGNPIDLRVRTVDVQYCEAVASKTVTARTIQPPVITATPQICPMGSGNASVAPPAEGGSWAYVDWQITNGHFGWDPYSGQYRTSTSGETVQFYGDGSGNPIDLRVRTVDGQYCEALASKTVTARTIAPPVITATPQVCSTGGSGNASVAPPAEGGSWAYVDWQITNGHFGIDPSTSQYRTSASGESVQFYSDGSGNPIDLRVRTVDVQYCEAVSSTTVTLRANPTVDIRAMQVYDSPGYGSIASDDGTTVEVCGDPTIRLVPTVLNPANTYVWSNGHNGAVLDVRESGTYTLTMTDANGCTAASSVTVHFNVPPAPPVITASGPTTFCEGGSVTLTAPAGFSSYLWINGATTQSIVVNASGSYSVGVTNATGCVAESSSVVVTVVAPPAKPGITASGATTFCEGGSVTLTAPAGYLYQWSTGATTQSISASVSGPYTVTVTDANGCASATSDPVVVTSNPPPATPVVSASGPTTFCEGGSVTLTAPAGFSYQWTTGATTQSIAVNASGSYRVTVTDANGCSATSAPSYVSVNPPPATPVISASGPTTFCEGGSVTLTAPASASYLWSNGATTPSIVVSASGSYSVTITNASGCSATSAATTVTVNAKPATPAISASGPTTFCEGGSVTLTAPASASYLWSTGATTQSITVTASGSYSVTVSNASGCSATSAPAVVTVNPLPATPTISASGPTSLCPGASVTLTAPAGFSAYAWSNGATTQSITVSTAGNYTVTVTNANGCSRTSTPVSVTANPPTTITTQPQSQPMPFKSQRDLSVIATGTATLQYQWFSGASGDTSTPLAGQTGSTLTIGPFPKKGTYRYWVRVTSSTCATSVANSTTATITAN